MGINAAVGPGQTSPETFYHSPYMTGDGGAVLRLNMDGTWLLVVGGGKKGEKVKGSGGAWRSGQWIQVQMQVDTSSSSPTDRFWMSHSNTDCSLVKSPSNVTGSCRLKK